MREKIKEVIDAYTDDRCLYPDKDCESRGLYNYCRFSEEAYKCLMQRLDVLGVVIKADKAGCESVEPLIEDATK